MTIQSDKKKPPLSEAMLAAIEQLGQGASIVATPCAAYLNTVEGTKPLHNTTFKALLNRELIVQGDRGEYLLSQEGIACYTDKSYYLYRRGFPCEEAIIYKAEKIFEAYYDPEEGEWYIYFYGNAPKKEGGNSIIERFEVVPQGQLEQYLLDHNLPYLTQWKQFIGYDKP